MTAPMQIKRYPIRGAIWGLLLGLGIAIYLLIFSIITFGDWMSTAIAVAAGVAVGVLWSMFAPARRPRGAPPAQVGGGYVPTGQPIAGQAAGQHPQYAPPPQPQATPPAQPAQPQYAPRTGIPGTPPPPAPAPAPPVPSAEELQPSFLTDPAPPPPGEPPGDGGGSRNTVVSRPDDPGTSGGDGGQDQRS